MQIKLNKYPYNLSTNNSFNCINFSLFDTKITDHILMDDDAIGWEMQGALVTSIYPEAVSKIKEIYTHGSDTEYRNIVCKHSIDGRYVADISQKELVDELFETTGIADFYILDNDNNQFYLPKSVCFTQYTLDTSLINNFKEAGLPNIIGRAGYLDGGGYSPSGTDAFYMTDHISNHGRGTNNSQHAFINLDASRSNKIYGNSTTVQPQSSLKLLYYKVGNKFVSENTNDINYQPVNAV